MALALKRLAAAVQLRPWPPLFKQFQLLPGIVGAWAAEVAAGGFGRSVHEALNLPARGVSSWSAAGAEAVGTFSLAFVMFEC
jgi:hypothetical protein